MKVSLQAEAIWVATQPVDFRKAIDGLCMEVVDGLQQSISKGVFIFYNRARDKLKIIGWHRNGYVLLYKRFEKTKLKVVLSDDQKSIQLDGRQLSWLLAGLDWQSMNEWSELKFDEFY